MIFCGVRYKNLKITHDCEPRRNEATNKTIKRKILPIESI
jgi:hypothetical protein